jgi:hypothetical protein
MGSPMPTEQLEELIADWRTYVGSHRVISGDDVDELEDHLRNSIEELRSSGLDQQEAFLVAVRRVGTLDEVTREFAREHSGRLWKQLVLSDQEEETRTSAASFSAMLGFAIAAAVLIKVPTVFGLFSDDYGFYLRNFAIFALAPLAAYFCWIRRPEQPVLVGVAGFFLLGAVAANAFGFPEESMLTLLTTIHLPIALWLTIGLAYSDGHWRSTAARMDFIRFTGEWFIYYVLIALGGVVLSGLTQGTFAAIGIEISEVILYWVIPCGAVGAVVVAAWLVEAKQSVVENMAPVLARIFTPLFAIVLAVFVFGALWTQNALNIDRELLIVFDLLLAVVLGIVIFAISAREPNQRPTWNDRTQLILIGIALVIDLFVLVSIGSRILDFGFTANKTAALGENLILLTNLAVSAWLLGGFVCRRIPYERLAKWQTGYLVVYSVWAWLVVLAFPAAFPHA